MQFYKRFIGDYGRDTAILTMEQDGAYGRLLDYYYATEKPLPTDREELYLIARAMSAGQRKSVDAVIARYFKLDDTGYRNGRADIEIAAHGKEAAAARENGKRGGRPKGTKPDKEIKPVGLFLGSESETQNNLSHSQNQINTPIAPKGAPTISLKTFIENCKANGETAISGYQSLWDYTEKTGIPKEWVVLAWRSFYRRHSDSGKRYKDWRKTFRNCVEGNWLKLWHFDATGQCLMTSNGFAEQKHSNAEQETA